MIPTLPELRQEFELAPPEQAADITHDELFALDYHQHGGQFLAEQLEIMTLYGMTNRERWTEAARKLRQAGLFEAGDIVAEAVERITDRPRFIRSLFGRRAQREYDLTMAHSRGEIGPDELAFLEKHDAESFEFVKSLA
jgi:hypothetical protein